MPDFDGFSLKEQISEINFEADTYQLLQAEPDIKVPRLLYHRAPAGMDGPHLQRPDDIRGRRLMVFQKENGKSSVWRELDELQKVRVTNPVPRSEAALTVGRQHYSRKPRISVLHSSTFPFLSNLHKNGFWNVFSSKSPSLYPFK